MAPVTPSRSIDDARRTLAAGSAGSPAILHQARMALIAGHRAAGDVDVAVALGERLLAGPLSPLDRGRALGGQAMSLIAADATDEAIAALTEAIPIFEQVDTPWFAAITEIALAGVDPTRRRELHASARARAGATPTIRRGAACWTETMHPSSQPTTRVPSARRARPRARRPRVHHAASRGRARHPAEHGRVTRAPLDAPHGRGDALAARVHAPSHRRRRRAAHEP